MPLPSPVPRTRLHLRHIAFEGYRRDDGLFDIEAQLVGAIQTFAGLQREDEGEGKPFQLDHCHALATTLDTIRRYYPKWYRDATSPGSRVQGNEDPRHSTKEHR